MSTSVFGFFGLRENPFSINPNPRFLYLTPLTQDSSHRLVDAIRDRKGLVLLTGEVGTGKTLLLRRLLDWLNEQRMPTALIFNSHVNPDHLLDFILSDFGIRCDSDFKSDKLIALNNWLLERFRAGQTPVLVIDEAQGLPLQALEEVRLLLNLETPRQKLLQVVLAGQPELEEKLRRHELRQLRQRITVRCRTAPLSAQETQAYIQSRLRIAGAKEPIFQPQAAAAVHAYARGIPRVMNLVCEHALINACADGSRVVTPMFVERAAHDCQLDQIESVSRVMKSSYGEPAASDDISSLFAGMNFADSAPAAQVHVSAGPDSSVPSRFAFVSADPESATAVNDSSFSSAASALDDPFSQTAVLPPSTDLAALGEYPAAAPDHHVGAEDNSRDGHSSTSVGQPPVRKASSLFASAPRAGVPPTTSSLFWLWWNSFLVDARSTARQLYAFSRKQALKLKPYSREVVRSVTSLQAGLSRLVSDPRWKTWSNRALKTIKHAGIKISTVARNRFAQCSAYAKARLNAFPQDGTSPDQENLRPGSKMTTLLRWLREPFASPSGKARRENHSAYRDRS
jgi:general secretion pathway protein A